MGQGRDWDESLNGRRRRAPGDRPSGYSSGGSSTYGYGPNSQQHAPETGRWSTSGNRWVPHQRPPDDPAYPDSDYSIRRFEDTGELWNPNRPRPGQGHVLDNHDWYEDPPYTRIHPYYQRLRYTESEYQYPGQSVARREPGRLPTGPTYPSHPPGSRREVARRTFDEFDEPTSGRQFVAAELATILWYLLPLAGYLGWAYFLSKTPIAGCVTELGSPCPSPRSVAVDRLLANFPELGLSLSLSLTVSLLLRWITTGWHALAVGFAASVVGAGAATVLFTALSS